MYLYSNVLGTFVFNQNFQIREKTLFSAEQSRLYSQKIMQGEVIETEKPYIERFKNIEDLRQTKDVEKIRRVLNELAKQRHEIVTADTLSVRKDIRDSVKQDMFIIQTISSIDELAKVINTLSKRLREWYSYYFPEADNRIEDHKEFAEMLISHSKQEIMRRLSIEYAMGPDPEPADVEAIRALCRRILSLFELKDEEERYLDHLMKRQVPNIREVAGTIVGAKLLALSGSLKSLVMFPASTVQLLGAEEALFKHIRKGTKPPKHGVLFQHPVVQKAPQDRKGKAARLVADKISIAAKVDYFGGQFMGDRLVKDIEEKMEKEG